MSRGLGLLSTVAGVEQAFGECTELEDQLSTEQITFVNRSLTAALLGLFLRGVLLVYSQCQVSSRLNAEKLAMMAMILYLGSNYQVSCGS